MVVNFFYTVFGIVMYGPEIRESTATDTFQ